jgi:EAL domain-containing protein (putative c-di-GMP-specific phosphodiesterase class I)/GGDEF domain-containing protein
MPTMTQPTPPSSLGLDRQAIPQGLLLGQGQAGYPPEFLDALDVLLRRSHHGTPAGALIIVGIENLAMIMSGYGPAVSEDICLAIMERLAALLSPADRICRLHKDQFALLLAEMPEGGLSSLTCRLSELVQQFGYQSEFGSLHVLPAIVSIDLADPRLSLEDVLDKSFIALRTGHGVIQGLSEETAQDSANSRQEMGLANYLGRALLEQRLRLAYQPIIESKTGRVAHYEALLRIVGADGKISSAGTLIPVAERMGLINLIDEQVLDMVIAELARAPELVLAFNVSNLTTSNRQWLAQLKQRLREHPDVAERLIVEITETAVHRDLKKTAYFVAAVQSMGAQVALDDFGSGYTSFRQLKSLSVDMVKIDGVFVRDLVDNNDNRLFVKTMLDFTNGFGLKAVAEFVETGEIAKMLMELGVEYMQGYYFGKPENHRSWLKES